MDIKCFKCGVTDHEDNAHYCYNCGIELNNYCTNENCELNNGDNPDPCAQKASYCPWCGSETTYFQSNIVKPELG